MTRDSFPFRLYLVLSGQACIGRDPVAVAEAAVKGGVDLVQLREKELTTPEFLQLALRLQDMLSRYEVPLIINDNLEVARQSSAYGIHVGNNDLPPLQIRSEWTAAQMLGYSIEYIEQLDNPHTATADYLGISPVFSTTTKQDTVTEWGLQGISTIRAATSKPLVAIGGIHTGNATQVIRAGADCIAVVSAICAADDPAQAACDLRNKTEQQ